MAPAETHAEKRIAFDQNPLRDLEKKADAAHRRRQRAVFTCKKASSSRKKRKLDNNNNTHNSNNVDAMMIVSKNPPPLPRDSSFLPFSVDDAKQSVKDWLLHLQEVVPDCYDIHAQSHRKCQCLSYCNAELVSDFVISFCSAHYSQRDAMVRSILWHGDAALDQMRRASKYHGGNHNAGNNNSDEEEEVDEELNQALGNHNNNTNKGLFQFAPTTSKRVYKLANGNGALQNNLYAIPDCDGTRFCLHGFCNLMWIRRPEQQLLLTDKKTSPRPTRLERRAARDKIKAETPEEHLQVRCRLHKLAPAVTSFLKKLAHREGTPMEYPRDETTGDEDDEDGEQDEDDDVDAVEVVDLPEDLVARKERPYENNAKKRGFEDEELDMMDAEEDDDDNDNDDDDDDLCADAEQPRMLSSRFAAVVDVYRTYVFEEGYEIHSRDGRKSNHKVRGDEAWVQSKREPGEVCTPEKFEQLWTSLCPHIVLYRNEEEQQENNKESPSQQQAQAQAQQQQDDSNNNKKEEPDAIKVVTWDAASNTLVKSWLPTTLVVEQVVDFLETLALQEGSKKEAPAPKPVGMFNVEDDEDEDDSDEPQIWYLPKRFNVDFVYGLYCNAQGFEKAQRLLLAQPRQDAEWKNSRGNDGGQRRFGTICALFTFKQLWKKYASHVQRARSATATAAAAAAKQESEKQAGSNNNNMDGSVPKPKKPKTPLNVINHEIVPVVVDFLQGLAEREAEEESLSGDNDDEEEEDEQALIQKLVDRQPIYVLPAHYSLHGVYTAFCYHQGVIFKKTRNRYGKYGYGKLTELPVRTDDEWVQSNKPVGLLCTQNFFNKIWDACCSHIVVQQNTSGGNGGGGSGNNNNSNNNNEAALAQSEREEQEQQTQIVDEMVAAGTIPPVVVQELHQLRERVQALESNRQRDRVKMRKLKQLVVVAATTATTGGANDDGGRHPNAAGRYCTHNGL